MVSAASSRLESKINEALKAALPIGLIVSVPSFMALIGIIFNRMDANRLDLRMTGLEARISSFGEKVDRLKDTLHSDVQQLLRLDADKHVRIARLEPRA